MKNYIFFFLLLLANSIQAQNVKVSGGGTGVPPMASESSVGQTYNTFQEGDKFAIFMVNAADEVINPELIYKTEAEHSRVAVSSSVMMMPNDIVCMVMGSDVGIGQKCKFDNFSECKGAKFDNDALQTNKYIPVFVICREELLEHNVIKELLANTPEYDSDKIKEVIDKAGLSSENIKIVYSIISRDEE